MPSSSNEGASRSSPTGPRPALDSSCRALARGLDNAAQVIAAWSRDMARSESADELEPRLQRAARCIQDAALLVAGQSSELSPEIRSALGVTDEAGRSGLCGHSAMVSLPDFVSFLSNLGRNGVLEVVTEDERFTIELQRSSVVYVTGNSPHGARLGDLLVEDGALDEERLAFALEERRETELLGDALLRLDLVREEDLEQALCTQMFNLFSRMHEVSSGFDFRFEEGRSVMPDSHARLGASRLLLEGARLRDEGSVRRRGVAGENDSVFGESLGATWLAGVREEEGHLDLVTFREFVEVLFLEESLTLPGLPESTSRLLELTHCEEVDLDRILEELGSDPSLAAHVLRAACAHCPPPSGSVPTLQDAVLSLGELGLRELAVHLTLNGYALGLGSWQEQLGDLWSAAALAGDFGARLGRDHLGDAELGRVLALLLDLGKPVVLGAIHDIEKECECRLAPSAAKHVMETYHARAGAWLARKWGLPESLAKVIEHHHAYETLEGELRLQAQVASLARELAVAVRGRGAPALRRLAALPACVDLGLDAELLGVLLMECTDAVPAAG
jgi:HD-like signal output (HDOD) protein